MRTHQGEQAAQLHSLTVFSAYNVMYDKGTMVFNIAFLLRIVIFIKECISAL